jgi:RimJ/RimL family protein N-acetyltransferase
MHDHASLAHQLPDLPRWVEARSYLLAGQGDLFGVQQEPALAFVLRDPDAETVFVVGTPAVHALHAAVQPSVDEVIAPDEQTPWLTHTLPAWTRTPIRLHQLPDPGRLPPATRTVRFLDVDRLDRYQLPGDVVEELTENPANALIAATFVGPQPVSFCYAGSITETLWDVSIDTLPAYRRQGHAAQCATFMIRFLQGRGQQPVWASAEDNPASWRLAHTLGFVAVDTLALFAPRP